MKVPFSVDLTGKTAIVTGGSGVLCSAMAYGLAVNGAKVAIIGRNKEKLALYYKKFMEEGIVDPNVHPWVAESWQRCRKMKLPHETMPKINKLSREEIVEHQRTHEFIVKYVDGLYEQSKQHFNIHNLSMLLIDEDGYVIKNYALPFFQRVIEDIQGMRVLEEDVGTSSISIAREHNVPFLMFGPEMWIKEGIRRCLQRADLCGRQNPLYHFVLLAGPERLAVRPSALAAFNDEICH